MDDLEKCSTFPTVAIMDNSIYYGDFKIIGNRPITFKDLDNIIISASRSISYTNQTYAYLQYGLIYRENPIELYDEHYKKHWDKYRNEGIGFYLYIPNFEEVLAEKSNEKYFEKNVYDLRNPKNKKDKEEIFKLFGLDANLDYEGNLKLVQG